MYKIFVGNVNFTTTEDQIKEAFCPHIVVDEIVIARDDSGKSKGYAFVLTREQDKARTALRQIGKPLIDGRRVYIKEAHGKKTPPASERAASNRPVRGRRPLRPRTPRPRPARGYTASSAVARPQIRTSMGPTGPSGPRLDEGQA